MRNSGMGTDTSFMAYCRAMGKPYGLYGQSYFPAFVEGDRAAEHIDAAQSMRRSSIAARRTLSPPCARRA